MGANIPVKATMASTTIPNIAEGGADFSKDFIVISRAADAGST